MALVITPSKPQTKRVNNLGWLLRNWKQVTQLALVEFKNPSTVYDGFLVAYMLDGRVYMTSFACLDVAREWLKRPVFCGLPLYDCGVMTRVKKSSRRSDIDRVMTGIAKADKLKLRSS